MENVKALVSYNLRHFESNKELMRYMVSGPFRD